MNKQLTVFLLVMLLYIVPVCSINAGEPYELLTIDKCEDKIDIKVRWTIPSDNHYTFDGCIEVDNGRWECTCVNPSTITFIPSPNIENEFDIVIEYYLNPYHEITNTTTNIDYWLSYNHDNRRTDTFSNIVVGLPPEKGFEWPKEVGMIWIIIVILLMLGGITYLILMGWSWLMNKDENKMPDEEEEDLDSVLDRVDRI